MSNARAQVEALAEGRSVAELVALTWTQHGGIGRPASTLIVRSDLATIEAIDDPADGLGGPPPRQLGPITADDLRLLAAALIANDFDRLAPPSPPRPGVAAVELSVSAGEERWSCLISSPSLDRVPAMRAVGEAFARLRATLPK